MATYVYDSAPVWLPIRFDLHRDTLEFGAGITAAQIFTTGDDDDGEISLFTDQRFILLLLDDYDGIRFSSSNFEFANGSLMLVGDNSFGFRDDEFGQVLEGSAQGDFIAGLGGSDTMLGGDGNDAIWLLVGETDNVGSDVVNGGAGIDTLVLPFNLLEEETTVSNINLATGVGNLGPDGTASISNIENVIGSHSRDVITGTGGANLLAGLGDADTLAGGGGDDTLVGGEGNDRLDGGDGNDLLRGQAGRDTILGGAGNDIIAGTGLRFDTTIDGGAGTDTIRVPLPFSLNSSNVLNVENIELSGPIGNEIGSGVLGELPDSVVLITGASNLSFLNDLVLPTAADLTGNSGANRMTGNAGNNGLEGMQGNDTLDGGGGRDIARYQNSTAAVVVNLSDSVQGGLQAFTASDGFGGIDTLISIEGARGGSGNDTFFGGSADEMFNAGSGNDSILGGTGDDTIRGREGADIMHGGEGIDLLSFSQASAGVNANLETNTVTNDGHGNVDTISGFENVAGWFFNDTLTGSSGANRLYGNFGSDTLTGGLGNDLLDGGRGHDEARYDDSSTAIVANMSTGSVTRGAESDTLRGVEAIVGGSGSDSITGQDNHFVPVGGANVDAFERYEGLGGDDTIDGGGPSAGFVDIVSYRNDFGSNDTSPGVAVNLGPDSIDLAGQTTLFTGTLNAGTALDGFGGTDILIDIDFAWGSSRSDYLRGGSSSTNADGDLFEAFQGFAGHDTIDGGDGIDRADYHIGTTSGVIALSTGGGFWNVVADGSGYSDILRNIEGIRGSAQADNLSGWDGFEFFEGMGGNDTLNGHSNVGGGAHAHYRFSPNGVTVDLNADTAQDGFGGTDTLLFISGAVGSDFSDLFIGQEDQDNTFDGGLGVRIDPSTTLNGGIGVHQDQVSYGTGHFGPVSVDLGLETANDGGGGTDTLIDIEVVTGTPGDDTIIGSNRADEYRGLFTDPSERFIGGSGFDLLDGGAGEDGDFDNIQYFTFPVVVNLGPSFQSYSATGFSGFIFGETTDENGAFDQSFGSEDTLRDIDGVITGSGNDLIFGGSNSRSFNGVKLEVFSPGSGNDTVVGLDGFDYISYQGRTDAAVNVNLGNTGAGSDFFFSGGGGNQDRGTAVFFNPGTGAATGEVDLLIGIDGVRGTQLDDTMRGGQGDFELNRRQVFEGNKGNDVIDGGGESQSMSSYRTSPTGVYVDLGRGFALDGWGTIDFLSNIAGARGSDFDDTLVGGGSRSLGEENWLEFFEGGAGNDIIDGGDDADIPRLPGEVDHDIDVLEYRIAPGAVTVDLGAGTAQDGYGTVDTFEGIEGVAGSRFGDSLVGSAQAFEVFTGFAGNDTIHGGDGIDMLQYDVHDVGVVVNLGVDTVESNEGVTVVGGTALDSWGNVDVVSGIEWVVGTRGDDIIFGNDADNYLEGLEGEDYLRGGGGNDTLLGHHEQGHDIADYGSSTMGVHVNLERGTAQDGLGGEDHLVNIIGAFGSDFDDLLAGDQFMNFVMGRQGFDTLRGGAGNDWAVYDEDEAGVNVNFGTGTATDGFGDTDTLEEIEGVIGSDFDDTLTGGSGNDSFDGRVGNDTIDGGGGFDAVTYEEQPNAVVVNLSGGAVGIDDLILDGLVGGGSTVAFLYGGQTIQGGTAFDGHDTNDSVPGVQSTVDTLLNIEGVRGSRFDDLFIGPAVAAGSRVFFVANGGNDTIIGGGGDGQTILSFAPREQDRSDFDFSDDWSVFANLADSSGGIPAQITVFSGDGAEGSVHFLDIDGVVGGRMTDFLTGDSGNNYFRGNGSGDRIDGDGGFDTVSYRDAFNPIVVNLSGSAQTFTYFDADGVNRGSLTLGVDNSDSIEGPFLQAWDGHSDGAEGFDNPFEFDGLQDVEAVEGGAHNDTIVGSAGNNRFTGLDGDDEFRPLGGKDFIDGGAGNDRVSYFNQSTTGVVVDLGEGLALKSGGLVIDGEVFTRAFDASKPIVGSWTFQPADLGGHLGTVTFLSNGTFLFSHVGSHVGGLDGIERGTFTTTASGGFGTTLVTDALPGEGFGSTLNFTTFQVDGDTLVLDDGNVETPAYVLTRVAEGTDGLTGAWFSMDAGQANSIITLTFDGEGGYVVAEDGDPLADPSGQDGLETGTFFFASDVGFLSVVNTIDTNGEWGLTTVEGGNAAYLTSVSGSDQLVSIEQVFGTALADRLTGADDIAYTGRATDASELFAGGPGNDTIDGGGATDGQFDILHYGFRPRDGSGNDLITSGQTVNLGTGLASGGAGSDVFTNIDMVIGSRFGDVLTGGSESRSFGGVLFEAFRGSSGNDTINGQGGEDRVDYQDAARGVNVTLGNGINAGTATDGLGGTDTLRNVEQARGSSFADTLSGGGTHNAGTVFDYEVFEGLEGNDLIDGKGGHDIASYLRSSAGVIVNLGSESISYDGITLAAGRALDGFGTTDRLTSVEGVVGSDFADYIQGSDADVNQTFRGGAGNDTIHGGGGNDMVLYTASASAVNVDLSADLAIADGYGGTDLLSGIEGVRGSAFADTLTGSSGNNVFAGLRGSDTIDGGAGLDVLDYSRDEQYGGTGGVNINLGSGTVVDGFGDTDTFTSIEGVIATRFDDTITGTAADEDFEGGAGNDSIVGGGGNDRLVFTNAQAAVTVNFALGTVLDGTDRDLVAAGIQAGTDTFTGIAGAVGTAFNDTFIVASANANIDGGAGSDTLVTAFTFSLASAGANIENLTLSGSADLDATGNDIANVITGNSGANELVGGAGNDTLVGGAGADTLVGGAGVDSLVGGDGGDRYVLNSINDVVVETGTSGTDTIVLSADFSAIAVADFTYTASNGIENVTDLGSSATQLNGNTLSNFLVGNLAANTLIGGAGNDTLDGLSGADSMVGGTGNDLYRVRDLGDVVNETLGGGGIDTVESQLETYELLANFENLTLLNAIEVQVGRGNNANNRITGNDFDNQLFGGLGNDTLEGGLGADRLFGGAGGDSYIISGFDLIIEVGGSAADKALAAISLDLTNVQGIENAEALGTDDVDITGNKLSNVITGNTGDNVLNGGAGNDTLNGGAGDDVYILSGSIDRVIDTGGGIDGIQADFTFSLGPLATIENLTLVGGASINGTGNALGNIILGYQDLDGDPLENLSGNNVLAGLAGNDTLDGGAGNDTLDGGLGSDSMVGGTGNDVYVVDAAGDRVNEGAGADGTADEVRSAVAIDLSVATGVVVSNTAIEHVTLTLAGNVNAIGNDSDNVLAGNAGRNSIAGGPGADTISGGAGNDTLAGGDGIDLVIYETATAAVNANLTAGTATGGAGVDAMSGFEQARGSRFNDTLTGGAGATTLTGGLGNDRYVVGADDTIAEIDAQGVDTVVTGDFDVVLGATLENAELTGNADLDAEGNALANSLKGNAGDNVLNGMGGKDTMAGGAGDDTYHIDTAGEVITELAGGGTDTVVSTISHVLGATLENLTLGGADAINATGNAVANILIGNAAANVLNGMGGADQMSGGDGNDIYVVDNVADTATEAASEGVDLVQSSVTFTLGDNVENLLLSGAAGASGTGNGLANIIVGNTGANVLSGGAGNDTIAGGAGADSLVGGADTDTLTYAGTAGAVNANLQTGLATGAAGTDTLSGFEHVIGTNFNDTLAGSTGEVTLQGGLGNDRYVLFDGENVVIELDNQGIDTIVAGFDVLALADTLENVELTGEGLDLDANGNASANRLTGTHGSNVLDGMTGADTMTGLDGDDAYHVDNAGDVVTEAFDAGFDSVISTISYQLAANVEELVLGGGADLEAMGNALNNILVGNEGSNLLDGGLGDDMMEGGAGDDIYVVNSLGDSVSEGEGGGGGIDEIRSAVTIDLSGGPGVVVSFDAIEHVTLTGNAAANATGNGLANRLVGNSAANTLDGGLGDDTVDGAGGADSLTGGAGNDVYGVDSLLDRVNELGDDGGIDEVRSTLAIDLTAAGIVQAGSLNLVENVTLLGVANLNAVGNNLGNVLTGNSGNNSLSGGVGNDTLDGGAGADTLVGGIGDNVFIIDSAGDFVLAQGGGSVDELRSFVSVDASVNIRDDRADSALGAQLLNITHFTLLGSAGVDAVGNGANNRITGNEGDNVLDGWLGADTLDGGGGFDIAEYSAAVNGVTVSLADGEGTTEEAGTETDELSSIEGVYGGAGNDSITGDGEDNLLRGGAGNDTLAGGAGNDTVDYSTSLGAVAVNLAGGAANDGLGGTDQISDFEAVIGGAGADSLTGTAGNETFEGGGAADTMAGAGGDDIYFVDNAGDTVTEAVDEGTDSVFSTISHALAANTEHLTLLGTAAGGTGNELDNAITGNGAANTLTGNAGADTLDGGGGSDSLVGGAGDDIYMVDAAGDRVNEGLGAAGTDEVRSFVTINLAVATGVVVSNTAMENVTLLGSANIDAIGNALANVLTGNTGNNVLNGGDGADDLAGGAGNDTYVVGAGDEATEIADGGLDVVQAAADWTLGEHFENLVLILSGNINGTGNGAANVITGNAGANVLDGGAGADTLAGGGGNDTYVIDGLSDVIVETIAGVGATRTDTVVSAVDYTLTNLNLENLTLTGAALLGTGNAGANHIVGNGNANTLTGLAGNDTLDGGAGDDILIGGAGNDVYVIDSLADAVDDTAGIDTLQSADLNVDLSLGAHAAIENGRLTGAANLALTGNASKNLLTGNDGNNVLNGGAGADTMAGGLGDDSYFVDVAGDVIAEAAGAGSDTLNTSVTASLSGLLANLENVNLLGAGNLNATGNAAVNALTGNDGNNLLSGLGGNDVLAGGAGNDTLDGGVGADEMSGGMGDDRFILDHADDEAIEAADAGTDTVVSSQNAALGANLENLELTGAAVSGTGNELGNRITGNGLNNTLDGAAGNDTLNGGAGNDALIGGLGDDSFIFDAADGSLQGGAGTDSIVVNTPFAGTARLLNWSGTDIDARYESIERIDISGPAGVNNTLQFTLDNVQQLLDVAEDGILTIDGTVNDKVVSLGQDWQFEGVTNIGETFYFIYLDESGEFTLQLNQDLTQEIS